MDAFGNRVRKRMKHLSKWARREGIGAFRVYERDMPEHPFILDWYDGAAVLYVRPGKRPVEDEQIAIAINNAAEALNIEPQNVHVKFRARQRGLSQYERSGELGVERIVEEQGLKFVVNLSDYLDTGLFLDHRPCRAMVRDMARDKTVLNLFAYTGSFSIAAAAGGARNVTTVDMSNTYLAWAGRNAELNGQPEKQHEFIQADVLEFLKETRRRWDIIIADPPTFSSSKRMKGTWDVQRDHTWMLGQCLNALNPGGSLLFSTNLRSFNMNNPHYCNVEDISAKTLPPDFRDAKIRHTFLITHEK